MTAPISLIRVIHPITGKEMFVHPDIVAREGVWLPPCAADIDDATLAEIKARVDMTALKSELIRHRRAAAHKEVAVPKSA